MRITDALLGEHGALYPLLDLIERTASGRPDADVGRAQAELLASTLLGHARVEEDLLFAPLEAEGAVVGPLAAMRAEHEEIEADLARARTAGEAGEVADLLLRVVEVVRPHFAKEEQVLFPAAEEILPAATLLELGERWAEARLAPGGRPGPP